MHALVFLEPGHFHAALTLRAPQPRVSPEVFVYAGDTPERRDFLARVEGFNARAEHATAWRPVVRESGDPLAQLLAERPGDVVVVAGAEPRQGRSAPPAARGRAPRARGQAVARPAG